ncbi:hypothetical protein MCOR11_007045 [Pyricularia oryzae]|nr:hypothetical protein MCOR11_007045 [Pyricularia oryzae]
MLLVNRISDVRRARLSSGPSLQARLAQLILSNYLVRRCNLSIEMAKIFTHPKIGLARGVMELKGIAASYVALSPRETPLTLRPTLFGPRSRREEGRHLRSHRERRVRPQWRCYGNPRSCRAHGGRAALTSVGLGIREGVQGLNIWQSRNWRSQ